MKLVQRPVQQAVENDVKLKLPSVSPDETLTKLNIKRMACQVNILINLR